MDLQVGVKILLQNKEGKHLLLRRSSEKYPGVAQWDIPGGRIEIGAPLLENLKREVLEETGLSLAGTPRLIAAQDILRPPKMHVVRLTYIGEAEGMPKLDGNEHTEFKWCSSEEMKTMDGLDPYLQEVLRSDKIDS